MKNLLVLEKELNKTFINRKEEIRGLIIALLTRSNIIMLGDPGTGKTAMAKAIAKQIEGKYFSTLLTKTSTAEELFGAYDIAQLEQGVFKRNTQNTLIDSDIAFVDEVFKSNSETLNGLLGIMADREYRNGQAAPEQVITQTIVGASNEMPEGGTDGELAALWDRFELRYMVQNLKTDEQFRKLLDDKSRPAPTTKVPLSDIKQAYDEFKQFKFDRIIQNLIEIKGNLTLQKINVSDRRWHNCIKYMQANAWLEGRTEVGYEDLNILKHMLWNEPEQEKVVKDIVEALSTDRVQEKYDTTITMANDLISTLKTFAQNTDILTKEDFEECKKKIKQTNKDIKDLETLSDISEDWKKTMKKKKEEMVKAGRELQEKINKGDE